ncbi:hypothetical protein DITRI_Ditri02bG0010300 [Diplodiscus trichospermus]
MSHKIIIESDSSNAVKWVKKWLSVPWRLRNIIAHIEVFKMQVTVGLSAIFLEKLTQLQMDWRKLGRTNRWILLTSLTLGAPTGGFYVTD